MNHLKNETSPYLLQHAENPVDWYPWGEEAFERARREDKPVFLSIGYSTCHWCHVMAEESFEDQAVAKLLNGKFVSVKVDREERPDIDAVYMAACQMLTGSGGWPLSVFLTPDQQPFFAGTYFPKESTRGMMGFKALLEAIADAWHSRRTVLIETAGSVVAELQRESGRQTGGTDGKAGLSAAAGRSLMDEAVGQLKRSFDREYGGFGMAPKFPSGHTLLFLMAYYEQTGDREALEMAEKTLTQMEKGGMFDHLGGGFCRYSTDRYYLEPHFEKMLYDNVLLIACYGQACILTKKKKYLDTAERTAGWILREMKSEAGGFYSAQDADSQGEEGRFYTFTREELMALLGPEEGETFCSHYGVTRAGNFHGRNILHLLGHEEPAEAAQTLREKVFQYRKTRYPLHTDDKILTAWNGMAVWALANLYRLTKNKIWLQAAEGCCRFLLEKSASHDGRSRLSVSWRQGKSSGDGLLDDYGWMICGLTALYEATSDKDYLQKAERFLLRAMDLFGDDSSAGFSLWGKDHEQLVTNPKETYDGAQPSGNSVIAYALTALSHYSRSYGQEFEAAAERQMDWLFDAAKNHPSGHCFFLLALSRWLDSSVFYSCRNGVCAPTLDLDENEGKGERQ